MADLRRSVQITARFLSGAYLQTRICSVIHLMNRPYPWSEDEYYFALIASPTLLKTDVPFNQIPPTPPRNPSSKSTNK